MTHPVPPRPRQPYPVASDYEDDTPTDGEPFEMTPDPMLGDRLGILQQWIEATHTECVATRSELGELRSHVMADHAPRITAVEQKTSGMRIPSGVMVAGKATGAVTAAIAFAQWVWPLVQQWLELRR